MRILVISNSEWDDNNSFGNTFSNFFEGMEDVEFANIYCRAGNPNTRICEKFLRIDDKSLCKSLRKPGYDPATVMDNRVPEQKPDKKTGGGAKFAKKHRWASFFIARELLWAFANYQRQTFTSFVEGFAPDMIFLPTYSYSYINKMALVLKKKYGLPIISYMSDDEYSLRKLRFSVFYWLLRIYQRKWVIRGLKNSRMVYVISKVQKDECLRDLGLNCKVLTKSACFEASAPVYEKSGQAVKLFFAGNIGTGRWKSLALLSDAVARLVQEKILVTFDIYTPTPLTERMRRALCKAGTVLHEPVPNTEIQKLQKEADILVHAEGLSLKNRLAVRQSFSTKLVDFFVLGKCIFAVGTPDVASVAHLIEHDAAVVAAKKEEVYAKLKALLEDRGVMSAYGKKAYECGQKCHEKKTLQKMLAEDIAKVVGEKDESSTN